jgi:hypothetical protein
MLDIVRANYGVESIFTLFNLFRKSFGSRKNIFVCNASGRYRTIG